MILHAGDIYVPSVLDELETVAPVLAAMGDDDTEKELGGDSRVAKRQTLFVEGVTLWLEHFKPPYGLVNPEEESYRSKSDHGNSPSVAVFGHTHSASIERYEGVLLVNPGSPTLPNYVTKLGTVALLTVSCGEVEVHIVQLEDT